VRCPAKVTVDNKDPEIVIYSLRDDISSPPIDYVLKKTGTELELSKDGQPIKRVLPLERRRLALPGVLSLLEFFAQRLGVPLQIGDIDRQLSLSAETLRQYVKHLRRVLGDSVPFQIIETPSKGVLKCNLVLAPPGEFRDDSRATLQTLLRGVPTPWASSVTALLIQHLGTSSEPAPFGGRGEELAALDLWLSDATAPRYAVIEAPAGTGKSTLLAHWAVKLQQEGRYNLVYFPISAGRETNPEVTVLQSIAFRLAHLFGQAAPQIVEVAGLRRAILSSLDRASSIGKPTVIVLDGLDEALGWQPDRSLFPPTDNPWVRIIVAARPLGEPDLTWQRRLGWQTPGVAKIFPLGRLDRDGLTAVLASIGETLAVLAARADVIEILFAKSEGDPLVLGLYIEELRKRVQRPEDFNVSSLTEVEPGLRGFFKFWLEDQHRLWGNHREESDRQVRGLMALCSVAYGPLATGDCRSLAPETFDSRLAVEKAGEQLERFVLVLGQARSNRRYVFQHSRLASFVREEVLEPDELDGYSLRFLDYCKRAVGQLGSGERKLVSEYVVRWYGVHLETSGACGPEYLPLVQASWGQEWERVEGSTNGFLVDLGRVWHRELTAEELSIGIRALLLRASVIDRHSLVDDQYGGSLEQLLRYSIQEGLVTRNMAEVIARRQNPRHSWRFLLAIAQECTNDRGPLLSEALDTAYGLSFDQASALAEVAMYLDSHRQRKVRADAIHRAHQISYAEEDFEAWCRSTALAAIARHLQGADRKKVLQDAIGEIRRMNSLRAHIVLETLIEQLAPDEAEFLQQVCELGQSLGAFRVVILTAHKLRGDDRNTALTWAEQEVTGGSDGPSSKARALSEVAVLSAPGDRSRLLQEAWRLANLEKDAYTLAEVVSRYEEIPADLLEIVRDEVFRTDPYAAATALAILSNSLNPQDRSEALQSALNAVRHVRNGGNRALALSSVISTLRSDDQALLTEAQAIAAQLRPKGESLKLLAKLASLADPTRKTETVTAAFRATQESDDDAAFSKTLARLASYLNGRARDDTFRRSFFIAANIHDPVERMCALEAGAINLAPSDLELLPLALDAMRWRPDAAELGPEKFSSGPWQCIQSLCAVALHLPEQERYPWIEEARAAASILRAGSGRARMLAHVAECLPSQERGDLLKDALISVREEFGQERATVLGTIVHLAGSAFPGLVEMARLVAVDVHNSEGPEDSIDAAIQASQALGQVAMEMEHPEREQVLREARALVRLWGDNPERAEWLVALAGRPTDEDHESTLQEAIAAATGGEVIHWRACEILVRKLGFGRPDLVLQMRTLVTTHAPNFYHYRYLATCAALAEHLDPREDPALFDYLFTTAVGTTILPAERLRIIEVLSARAPIELFSRLVDELRLTAYRADPKWDLPFVQIRFGDILPIFVQRFEELCQFTERTPLDELLKWLEAISHCSRADLLSALSSLAPLITRAAGEVALVQISNDISECRSSYP
jgi:hypothetical protein